MTDDFENNFVPNYSQNVEVATTCTLRTHIAHIPLIYTYIPGYYTIIYYAYIPRLRLSRIATAARYSAKHGLAPAASWCTGDNRILHVD